MSNSESQFRLKLRLFFPIAIIIVLIISIATLLFINSSIKAFNQQLENSLTLEVETITKMFERERQLKLEKVTINLKVARNLFDDSKFEAGFSQKEVIVSNQNDKTEHNEILNDWYLDGALLGEDNSFVDSVTNLLGGTATIFQKSDSGYVRISTNVMNLDGTRAINTYIPNNSPVIQSIEKGETYYGRAYVVNDWYITAYEPICIEGEIIGILYVGNKEKDLDKLRAILFDVKIGKTGYPFVFDKDGNIIIHPEIEGQNWKDSTLFKTIVENANGVVRYTYQGDKKLAVVKYFEDFEFYVAAAININDENKSFVGKTILLSSLVAMLTIIVLLVFLYFLTADRIYRYLQQLDISRRRLKTTTEKLEKSEDRFQKLFDSAGDSIFVTDINENIVEVNNASCINLGYTREEFLEMEIRDIKTPKSAMQVSENRKKIFENQVFTYDSEHLAKDGRKISVEIMSRLIDYNDEKLVLSLVRNITQRKETEKEILSTVIRTEERERARFASDMHDSVGPLLSTIKLYVNELKSSTIEREEREEYVNEINSIIDESISSIRVISNNLMPLTISKYGLIRALETFFEKVNKTDKIVITFDKINMNQRLDPNMELILFRVISELINNTLKHAKAKNIRIRLENANENIEMSFKDDGIGFDVEEVMIKEHKGMGLRNIISRIKSINGAYEFKSSLNNGFSININIEL
jgi:PAS domain S-box-containing protein